MADCWPVEALCHRLFGQLPAVVHLQPEIELCPVKGVPLVAFLPGLRALCRGSVRVVIALSQSDRWPLL